MPQVRILPPTVRERVAAGEVIDGPEAVVKELIENSLDAGATRIRVDVGGDGFRLVRVADDGAGILPDDVELAFQRYATSKIQTIDDLAAVHTLGFRGEALPSIAAVSEVTLVTAATGDGLATRVVFSAGQLVERGREARTRGTTVTVRRLFEWLPGRLKFVQHRRVVRERIVGVVQRLALSRPNVRFELQLDGRLALETRGAGPRESLADVFGPAVADAAALLGPHEVEGTRLYGFVTGRALTRPTRAAISLFVNGRWVESPDLIAAVEEGYRTVLPRGRHPVLVLFVDLPPDEVDVNVHPTKREVRLARSPAVRSALTDLVRAALGTRPAELHFTGAEVDLASLFSSARGSKRRAFRMVAATERSLAAARSYRGHGARSIGSFADLEPVAQVRRSLILCEGTAGFYLVDQHRAHERVLYEQLRERYLEEGGRATASLAQGLVEPIALELKPHEAARLASRLDDLAALGLRCEWFGGHSFLVHTVPTGGDSVAVTSGLADVLTAAASDGDWRDRVLVAIACRSALRKGQGLSLAEAGVLLDELARTESPVVCPHGAPVIVHVSDASLAKQFGWG